MDNEKGKLALGEAALLMGTIDTLNRVIKLQSNSIDMYKEIHLKEVELFKEFRSTSFLKGQEQREYVVTLEKKLEKERRSKLFYKVTTVLVLGLLGWVLVK